jgi:hypothetical protein
VIQITDTMRANYRRKFLEDMIPRLGFARPVHTHVDPRTAEREVLGQLVAEGLLITAEQRVDKFGHQSSRGHSTVTVWVSATDASKDAMLLKRHCITVRRP